MVGLSFSTPTGPTLTNITAELNGSNMNESIVVVTVDMILDGSFTLVVFDSSDALQTEISIGPFSFSSSSTPTTSSRTIVIRPSGLLSFGKTYRVKTLFSSSLIVSHTAPTFTIPEAPPSIGSFSVERQSNPGLFILILDGMDLPVGAGWTVTLSTGLDISGSFVSSTRGESDPLPFQLDEVTFNTTYTVSRVLLENGTNIILESNTFTTLAPPELQSVRASLDESKECVILVLTGTDVPHGAYVMTLKRDDNNAHLDISFTCWSDEMSPTFTMSSEAELEYGKTYRIVNMTSSDIDVFLPSPLSFVIPAIPSLVNVSLSFERSSFIPLTLTGEVMPDGTYEVHVMKSGTALEMMFTVDFLGNSGLIEVDVSDPFFVREEEYFVSSIHSLNGDAVRIPNPLTFVIPLVQLDITVYVSSVHGEESMLCGAKSRPCKSVDWAWGIVESLSMNSVSIALLDESELATSMEQTTGSLRMWSAGPNGMDRLVIPSSSSLGRRDAMIVIRSSLEMRQLEVLIEVSSPSFVLLSAVNAVVTLKQGSIVGTPSSSRMNADETSELCGWESGVIQLVNSSSSISELSFRQLSMGASLIKSGSLVIDTSEFSSNSPHFASFPSG
ncbi:hypothetical protein BLNAU_9886 [Blattamonas nauphoetae]|uniref:Uncharacterized protein n=1 Tax=Blattamonas nauphoetae TaxID=2049346 RepID=A0ABQ9XUJ5_9EUKA|nr:hypothetical protein BLNAU_9886 [Blattamonas nauphoetae]